MNFNFARNIFPLRVTKLPTASYYPERELKLRHRMSRLRASSRAGWRFRSRLSGLGDIDWGGLFTEVVKGGVQDRVAALNARRAEAKQRTADARARAEEAKMRAAEAANVPAVVNAPTGGKIPLVPLAIGGIALLGAGFFLLKKKR